MVKTRKCQVPGVRFHHSNSWQVQWCEQGKCTQCHFAVAKFMAHGVTDTEASLQALQAAIDFRVRKVGVQDQRTMKLIKVIPEGF